MLSPDNIEDSLRLGYLQLCCEQALQAANAPKADLQTGSRDYKKVCRRIGVVGEIVNDLPLQFKARYNGIDWIAIEQRREDWIARNFQIDSEELRQLCSKDVPALLVSLRAACASVER